MKPTNFDLALLNSWLTVVHSVARLSHVRSLEESTVVVNSKVQWVKHYLGSSSWLTL